MEHWEESWKYDAQRGIFERVSDYRDFTENILVFCIVGRLWEVVAHGGSAVFMYLTNYLFIYFLTWVQLILSCIFWESAWKDLFLRRSLVACVAAGPRTRLNHLYSPSIDSLYRRFRVSATQASSLDTTQKSIVYNHRLCCWYCSRIMGRLRAVRLSS